MTRLTLFLIASLVIVDSILTSPSDNEDSIKKHHSGHSHRNKKHGSSHSQNDKKHKRHGERTDLDEEQNEIPDESWNFENTTAVDNRRILFSKRTEKGKRPYMVYLQLTKESAKAHKYRGWLCGGVIVDQYYVLTSAACVEDADRFYIVSGTTKFVDSFDYKDDECVCKHRRKVVWKCIPKNYKFDFQDSIKWSSNDIAIVKVDKAFKFGVVETGCEFGVCPINYNNVSRELEKPGTKGWIAGWGSGNNFREGVYRRQEEVHIPKNAKCLQEAKVCIMDNEVCARKWAQKFREIITQFMICTRDVMKRLSEICDKRYANCTDFDARRQEELQLSNDAANVDLGRHLRDPNDYTARRSSMQGGFCENDHGGPLIIRYKGKETVVGVISACKIDPKTHSCHGPFLYTSIYRNRQFLSCSIHKDIEENCRRVFRSGITHEEWSVNWDDVKDDDDNDTGDKTADPEVSEHDSGNAETINKEIKQDESVTVESSSESEEDVKMHSERSSKKSRLSRIKAAKLKKKSKSRKQKVKKQKIKKHKSGKSKKPVEDSEETATNASYESSDDDTVNNPDNE